MRVLYLLTEIRDNQNGNIRKTKDQENFTMEQKTTMEDFQQFECALEEETYEKCIVSN